MQIIDKVKEYIYNKTLLNNNSKVIVGVSGGADSMALLDILHRLSYDCIAAHCNFHLRGEESDRDFSFVKNYCIGKNIEFIYTDFDTQKYMKEKAVSLEMAARELRYNWFEEIRKKLEANKIAVAHHQDDSVETLLINLIRGTGIRGLTGIPPINGNVVRPLLCLYREEIIEYLDSRHIPYIEDSTNLEDIYVRNKIRLNIIPLLETINPSVKRAISNTAENLLHTEKIYSTAIEEAKKRIISNNIIDIPLLLNEAKPETILFETLYPYGFNPDTVTDIFKSVHSQSGKVFYSKNYTLIKDRNMFILQKTEIKNEESFLIQETEKEINIPIKLKIETFTKDTSLVIEKNKNVIYLDKSKLTYPLTIRRWKQGDRFTPFGMKGSKKLSDYFSDNKFSLADKENVWLLCSGNKIAWIIGERPDNHFKITYLTSDIIRITLILN